MVRCAVCATALIGCLNLVAASCISNPQKTRRKLTNADGEQIPLGIVVGAYAAARVMASILQPIIEEEFGYETQGFDASGSEACLRAVAGCDDPNNVEDVESRPSCFDGKTQWHVSVDNWVTGYSILWEQLVTPNPSAAPLRINDMYMAGSGIYVTKAVWERKTMAPLLDTKEDLGLSESPAQYFDDISTFDSMRPCEDTNLQDTTMMAKYVEVTGDSDGVNADGTGVCTLSSWWVAPTCRSSTSDCVPLVTGGNGWVMDGLMQKATMWQMPLAIGVADSWWSYSEIIPMQKKCLFYWWQPDTNFILLEPKRVMFPEHDATQWAIGDVTTATKWNPVEIVVSHDLPHVAPLVHKFLSDFQFSFADMETLLREYKVRDAGRTEIGIILSEEVKEIGCSWVTKNEEVWQQWRPTSTQTGTTTATTATATTRTMTLPPGAADVAEPEGAVAAATLNSALAALDSEEDKITIDSDAGKVTVVKLAPPPQDSDEPVVFSFGGNEGEPEDVAVTLPKSLLSLLQSEGDVMLTVGAIDESVKEQLTAAWEESATQHSPELAVDAPVIEISLVKVASEGLSSVESLAEPIVFKLQAVEPHPNDVCVFFDTALRTWSDEGLTLLRNDRPGESGTWCEATHLSIFSIARKIPADDINPAGHAHPLALSWLLWGVCSFAAALSSFSTR